MAPDLRLTRQPMVMINNLYYFLLFIGMIGGINYPEGVFITGIVILATKFLACCCCGGFGIGFLGKIGRIFTIIITFGIM